MICYGPVLHHHEISQFFDSLDGRLLLMSKFLTVMHFTDAFCIIVPNIVEIGRALAEISQFLYHRFFLVRIH